MLRRVFPVHAACRAVFACSVLTICLEAFAGDPPIVIEYQGCGQLYPGAACPKFVGLDGTTFSIPNIGNFQIGDFVHVDGDICVVNCVSICQDGAIFLTNSISDCSDQALFNQCGTVAIIGENPESQCLVFQSDEGGTYLPDNFGEFTIGDRVRVISNTITSPCETKCGEVTACLGFNQIESCGTFIDECGQLVPSGSLPFFCIAFQGESGNIYGFNNIGEFGLGDFVRITGFTGEPCLAECGQLDGCIENNTIEACGVPFDECGTIVPGGSLPFFCLVFQANSGLKYYIDNIGNFGIGSHVRITGLTGAGCAFPGGDCGPLNGCIPGNAITGCPDINSSGAVDVDDLLAVINTWGPCEFQCPPDLDGDGDIDVDDLLIIINAWG